MKKQTILIYLLLGCYTAVFSQNGRVTGAIVDAGTKTPLELATVSIFKQDSSLLAYQLSDKYGKFSFTKLPLKQKLLVSVTYTGYIAFSSAIQLTTEKADTLTVFLELSNKDTQAVVVTARAPIRMNGDTLEINPAAFKMKEDAVVEELLSQVAGITIWSDGTITLNGKKIQNLLVDGKPFMGATDSRIATQNLPKSAIEKIQLYQEYDRSNIGQIGPPQDSLLTMNIKLKDKSKKGYFGKAGAGFGTNGRFETDLSFQMYTRKSSVGIGGGLNNINKAMGNIQEMFQNNTYRSYNPNLYNVGRFGTNGINKNHFVGGVYTHNFIETANSRQNNRVTVNYNIAGTDVYLTDLNLQNRTNIDHPQFISDEGVQKSRSQRHDLTVNYVKTNSYNDNLNVNGSVNSSNENGSSTRLTEVSDKANRLQSTNNVNNLYNRRSNNESFNGSFAKSNNEEPLKSFTIQFNGRNGNNTSERWVRSQFQSFTDPGENRSFNRRYTTNDDFLNAGASLDYAGFKRLIFGRWNFFGINLSLNQWLNYARSLNNSLVSDYDSVAQQYKVNSNLSNHNERQVFEFTPSLGLAKSFSKWAGAYYRTIYVQVRLIDDIKTDKNRSASFAKRNLDRSFQFFRQEGNASFQYVRQEKYRHYTSVNYTKNFEYPSIDQLYTIVDDINVYNIRIGNPGLRNRTNHSLNFNTSFNTQNSKSLYAAYSNIGGGYNVSFNPVTDSIINDASGKRISYYTNADKSSSVNGNYSFNLSRRFKKNNLQLMYNGQFRTGKIPNYIDDYYNISETSNLSNQFTIQLSLGSTLIVDAGQALQHYKSKQSAAGLTSFKNSNKITKLGIVLNYPTDFTFSSTLEHIGSSNLNKPTVLWNAFATYRFWKRRAELKGAAMDILRQYKNITNSVNAYGTTTRITNGLQQFFLLTFSYYPRKFGKTEMKKL